MLHHQSTKTITRSRWLKTPILSGRYKKWLLDKGSLTRRLQYLAHQNQKTFYVKPTFSSNIKPNYDETRLLSQKAYVIALQREVNLHCGAQSVVFAHSILPHQSLRGEWLGLTHLGTKPLGGVLFGNPCVKRVALSFKKINKHHHLYLRVAMHNHVDSPELWARRSVFYLKNARILVTEVFLPQLLKLA